LAERARTNLGDSRSEKQFSVSSEHCSYIADHRYIHRRASMISGTWRRKELRARLWATFVSKGPDMGKFSRAHNPNGISIGSAVFAFAGLTGVTYRQTDRQTDRQTTLLCR